MAEILISPLDSTDGQILGSVVLASRDTPQLVVMLQLYTCGIPSTIMAIMRASLWIGSTGPGS